MGPALREITGPDGLAGRPDADHRGMSEGANHQGMCRGVNCRAMSEGLVRYRNII